MSFEWYTFFFCLLDGYVSVLIDFKAVLLTGIGTYVLKRSCGTLVQLEVTTYLVKTNSIHGGC